MNSLSFENRVVLITGAGKGLGRAYAIWLAQRGATVVVNNRLRAGAASSARAVVDEITASGGRAFVDEHAVEDEAGSRQMIEHVYDRCGRLDVLVCNAGIADDTPFQNVSLDRVRAIMDVNFWGTLYPVHAAWPRLIQAAYGRIILTTSQAGLFGQSGAVAYASSKAAMVGMARALVRDVRGIDIRVNLIAPAAFTPMSSSAFDPRWKELLSPFKVAPVVGWLASEACQGSGMIFNVGAGRIRRVKILEGRPVQIHNEDVAACWPALDDMTDALESTSSFGSGKELMPELFPC